MSDKKDVDAAVKRAEEAYGAWSSMTAKGRAAIMFRFHALLEQHAGELVRDRKIVSIYLLVECPELFD